MIGYPRRPLAALALALLLAGVVAMVRRTIQAGDGLAGQYFLNTTLTEPASFTAADHEISTGTIDRRWGGTAPGSFSVRWNGYLAIGDAREYDFLINSDDGSRLFIDGRLLIDNSGTHGPTVKTASLPLTRGSHLVTLDYIQEGGPYTLELSWSTGSAEHTPIPGWRLSQRRVSYARATVGRVLGWLSWASLAFVVGAAAWTLHRFRVDRWTWDIVGRHPAIGCFVLFAGLTVLETWPLATNPGHLSRHDNGDALLNEWTLAWVAHQSVHDPLHLFQANIFHPEPNALAFSEAMLVQSAFAAPLIWAGGSPLLAFNLVLLAGFTLTGFAICYVVARWTNDWAAGIAAGIIGGFNAHTLTRMPHLQAQHAEFLPLTLLSLDLLLQQPRLRHAVSLAAWFVLQSLASYYLFVITSLGLVAAVLARPGSWRGRPRLVGKYLVIATLFAAAVLLPYLWPYWRAHSNQGMTRGVQDLMSAFWRDYLTTPGRIDGALLERFASSTGLFPGFIGLALATYAIARGVLTDPRARMCLVLGVVGVVLSFGAGVPGISLLFAIFPPLHGIRAITRFGYLGIVAVAILGGFGVATLRRSVQPRTAMVAGVVIPVLITIESLAIPIGFRPFDQIPPIYHQLDDVPGAVVADLPLAPHRFIFGNAPAMLNSTTSFYRLLNGYSGFIPASYYTHLDELEPFPAGGAVEALRRHGVTHVFVHKDLYPAERREAIQKSPALSIVAEDASVALYQLVR